MVLILSIENDLRLDSSLTFLLVIIGAPGQESRSTRLTGWPILSAGRETPETPQRRNLTTMPDEQ